MSDGLTDDITEAMRSALTSAGLMERHTYFEMTLMARAARNEIARQLISAGVLTSNEAKVAGSLRDDLIAAGVRGWRVVEDADGCPLSIGMAVSVIRDIETATGYLPISVAAGKCGDVEVFDAAGLCSIKLYPDSGEEPLRASIASRDLRCIRD